MNWWIGLCWSAGTLCFAALDYRARKSAGRRHSDWLWRLAMYFAVGGGLFAAMGYAPIALYRLGESIVGLYNHPPAPKMLLAFATTAVCVVLALEILKVAVGTLREAGSSLPGRRSLDVAWRIAIALVLFAIAVGLLAGSVYVLRNR
ncbi:hypothetical protein [Mesorhizobium sp. WSM3866]|uniref:hypothetical protein n=1 Tax=Mesorhizobium sp. WSM3866 TaxID=422271 RepID=UPI000BAEED16|nr:hypothetical protein [Mesorhizobium sp. WSM3866]